VPPPMTLRLLLALAALAPLPSADLAGPTLVAASDEAEPGACYTLVAPDDGWRVLEPAELRALAPGALTGMAGPRGVRVFLHAGPDQHPDLETSLEEALTGQGLEQASIAFVEETEVGERRALRGLVNGRRQGDWVRFHALVFREGPDLYRLEGWGRSETVPADGSTFEEATAGLRRLEGVTLDLLPHGGRRADADGPGWRVREGVYRDAALGFELDPRGPWRVALGSELGPLAGHSHVGLVDEQHDAQLAVVVERAPASERGAHAEDHRRAALGEAFGSGELDVSAGGRRVTLRLATVPALPGTPDVTRQLAVGVLFEEDLCVQLIARHPAANADRMTKSLEQALASVRVLDGEQRRSLALELQALPPALDAVGKGWALRGRTFTHFSHGLRWTAPAGFWEVIGGEGVDPSQPGEVAQLHERQSGLWGTIVAVAAGGLDTQAWHAAETERLLAHGQGDDGAPVEVQLGDLAGRLSWGELKDGSGWSAVLASCVRDDTAVALLLRGPPDPFSAASRTALSAVSALEISSSALPPTEMAPGSYVDLRLGFALESPDPTWSFQESKLDRYGPSAAAADGVLAGFEASAGRGVYVAAAWTQAGQGTEDSLLGPFIPSGLRLLAQLPERPADEDLPATFRGRPSRLLAWREGERRIEVALLWRGRTAVALCAVAGPGDPPPRQWLAGFRLLE